MLAEIHTFRLCEFHLNVLKREEKWFQVKHQWASKTGQQPCKQTRWGLALCAASLHVVS